MPSTKQLLEELQQMGFRSSFDLKDGEHYEGYILEVSDERLLFAVGGPMSPKEPVIIPVGEVDLGRLAYWDADHGCYMNARWDDIHASWSRSPCPPANHPPAIASPWWKFW
jgi:hypothetical protein